VKRGVSQDYSVEIAIPWSSIGGKPATDDFAAMFTLHNNDGVSPIVHENLSGANPDKPMTWMRVKMDKVGGSSRCCILPVSDSYFFMEKSRFHKKE
jgi:hypothetical protein